MEHDDHDDHDDHGTPNNGTDVNDQHNNQDTSNASTHGSGHEGMLAYLFTRSKGFFVLFEGAYVSSTGGFVGAVVGSFAFAIVATILILAIHMFEKKLLATKKSLNYLLGSLLYAISNLLHYTAMLLVMTMNVWVIIAVLAGHAAGYLVYALISSGHRRSAAEATAEPKVTDV